MTHTLLEDLLKNNFENYQVMWNENRFHTHVAHHLGSLALLGASDEQLKVIYENTMCRYVEKYQPSPHDITKDNWRDSLGDKRFCLAYRNFFDQQLPKQGDWKKKFFEILLDDAEGLPLIDGAFCDLIHPIIHIDYAIELNNRSVACEALTMTAVCFGAMPKIPTKLKPPTNRTKGALQIMKDIRRDDDASIFEKTMQIDAALDADQTLLSHYNDWNMSDDLDKVIEELFDMSVYLYGATHKPDQIDFDFVLLHLLTGMNAIRKVRHHLDENTIKKLLLNFFYISLAIYIAQKQPKIDEQLINDYQIQEDKFNWKYVIDQTLNTKLATEVHFVKVIRALRDAEKQYGSKEGLYLKTAVKSADHINIDKPWNYYKSTEPWIGTANVKRELNVKH